MGAPPLGITATSKAISVYEMEPRVHPVSDGILMWDGVHQFRDRNLNNYKMLL